ncbi:hypothetical protein QR680_015589 [Steinernema hermaphroditum]|uniref:SIFamide n=1 Tax=Steinernema hermaphroditum TaxID=289476 RepID=A0AA39H8A9_9BILA|nr:hypothetical protein QR680_015589 [Steinernema hermaphroditum]
MKVVTMSFLVLFVVSATGVLKFPRPFDAPQSKNGFSGAEKAGIPVAIIEKQGSLCRSDLLYLKLCRKVFRTGGGFGAWPNKNSNIF